MNKIDNTKKNIRLGLVLASIAVFMFFMMILWAYQYLSLPT